MGAKGTRAARTKNMPDMSLTLEVSKLSGWLKADASCRVEGRVCDAEGPRGASREAGGPVVWAAQKGHARGNGPTQGLGAKGTRGERTYNMKLMVVTLEVSKLSGWLKAYACCRVEGRACDAGGRRCEPGGGRAWGVVAAHKRHAWGPTLKRLGAKGMRGERTLNM